MPEASQSRSADFIVTVEYRDRRCQVAGYASDPVGAIASQAATLLGVDANVPGDLLTLATLEGLKIHHNERMGYPAENSFRLLVTGGVV